VRLVDAMFPWALALAFGASCYSQPGIPRDKPLTCSSGDASNECPVGFVCVADTVCAPRTCRVNEDCPPSLVCNLQRGCVVRPDAGATQDDARGSAAADATVDVGLPDGGEG